jgi:hypothetical protein
MLVRATRHSVAAPFAALWRSHGGLAHFGAPITPVFERENRDGSGRSYTIRIDLLRRNQSTWEELRYQDEIPPRSSCCWGVPASRSLLTRGPVNGSRDFIQAF